MQKERLFEQLKEQYRQRHRKSEMFFEKARQLLIMGGSHSIRLFSPFPFYDLRASGSQITDIDGHTYIDFWQGHFANVLGHNPGIVTDALAQYFQQGQGLITGFPGIYQSELAELILNRLHLDKIRFTTSGTLAAMYGVMLAKSFTGRELVVKVGGGWHGAQPYGLKGVSTYDRGLDRIESAGLPPGTDGMILTTKFNDIEDLERVFTDCGERIACFIVEPFVGTGGLIFAHEGYLQKARELTEKYGSILIMDEVISGFRFHAGPLYGLYGIKPDLCILGKIIGGGMPVSAVAGGNEIMSLLAPDAPVKKRVRFEGGTFSAHPACMLAGATLIRYLIAHEGEVYPRIGQLGAIARKGVEEVFKGHGFNVKCTGSGGSVTQGSSFVGVHFLKKELDEISSPEDAWNPEVSDSEIREKVFKLAMMEEGFSTFHGYGAISAAHSSEEIQASVDAVERIAKRWSKSR